MKKTAFLLIVLCLLLIPGTFREIEAGWPQIPNTAFFQQYGNIIVHSDFGLIPLGTLIRWSLARDIWLQRLNWWALDQSPVPVHIILVSEEKKGRIFKGFSQFSAPGTYFYDSNNNAFWFSDDISQNTTVIFLENGDFYTDQDGSSYIFTLMLEKLFRWVYGPNELWNTRALWGHNPFLLNVGEYASAVVEAKAGLAPPTFSEHRFFTSWEEVKNIYHMAGWPKEHIDRVPPPVPSSAVSSPDRYRWYRSLGIIDREVAIEQLARILSFFAGKEPRAQEFKNLVIRDNLKILEEICEKREDC